ncbi:hypothetical protein [Cognaticolwellia mytili]|uniref:hypothetical protein n=1 Tax=Cognaticolwellia mytili TaxID=1888913 RepID=UPI000A16F462|nr:hypothetical protein [Cognaticolwellia mytili]
MDIMTEQLPISIQVSDDLVAQINNIAAICNKLEAQLNFHTMTANWYGEEENILLINFNLVGSNEFDSSNDSAEKMIKKDFLADDVFILSSTNKLLDCHVAITASELPLLQQKPKLLSGYLGKKLTKVLNLIAQQQGFEKI